MRRDNLRMAETSKSVHPGLWLDCYVNSFDVPKSKHYDELFKRLPHSSNLSDNRLPPPRIPACATPEGYSDFYRRLESGLRELAPTTLLAEAKTQGRLAIGLGGESVLETSICLHRTWGVPYLPGSALKGLAAKAARNKLAKPWDPTSREYQIVFGDQESCGYVTFHDAMWKPFRMKKEREELISELPLLQDVMTVHHADYYGWNGGDIEPAPPADWDDPSPVPFVSAHGSYLLALTGPPGWVELALKILAEALQNDGIGAKTAAGYGRMKVEPL